MPYQPHGRFFGGSHPQAEGSSICKLGSGSKKLFKPPHSLLTNDSNAIEMALKWPNPWPNPNFWNPPPKALSRVTVTFSPQCFWCWKSRARRESQRHDLDGASHGSWHFYSVRSSVLVKKLMAGCWRQIFNWQLVIGTTYQQVNGNRITSIHLECQGVLASMTTKFCPAFVTT